MIRIIIMIKGKRVEIEKEMRTKVELRNEFFEITSIIEDAVVSITNIFEHPIRTVEFTFLQIVSQARVRFHSYQKVG